MSKLDEILKETGENALDLAKKTFKELLLQAKDESEEVIKETGKKLEKWIVMRAEGELDDEEFKSLLKTRRRVVEQFLLSKEIDSQARLEKISIGLIEIVTDKFIGAVL